MEALPTDVLVVVASHMDMRDLDHLLAVSRTMHNGVDETFFYDVAVRWRGLAFWARAFSRRTRHTFRGMRIELRILQQFEETLRRRCMAVWTEADYCTWWRAEETVAAARAAVATHPARLVVARGVEADEAGWTAVKAAVARAAVMVL